MANVSEKAILNYLENSKNGLSIGEAFINWQLSGGHLTKLISNLRKDGVNIKTQWNKNPVTKRRFARYFIV